MSADAHNVEPDELPAGVVNNALFSDHCLRHRLVEVSEAWRVDEEAARIAYDKIWDALCRFRSTYDRPNEPQTEDDLVRPVLDVLGFARVVETDAKRQGQGHFPDYTLFENDRVKSRVARYEKAAPTRFYSKAIAIAEAEHWGKKLDSADRADPFGKTENPSQQIVRYLGAVRLHNGPEWGILTDGKRWRLYYELAADRTAEFYEVDLESVCTGDYDADRQAFRYFYWFFRRDAFVKDPRLDQNFLEWFRAESQVHSRAVESELKDRVFDHIFPYLAKGFIQYRRRELTIAGPETEAELRVIFSGTLYLLYRLLFLLYAEDRDLLPISERGAYYDYSLTKLKFELRDMLAQWPDGPTGQPSYALWERLQTLFGVVSAGEAAWNVPKYNGRLFSGDGPHGAFLSLHKVPDDFLAFALDHLCRNPETSTSERDFIDYKDLDVRQLGSIYEGLLEFRLEWADRDLVVVKDQGRYVYRDASDIPMPAEGGRPRRGTYAFVKAGQLYLVNDRKERRATGSYFTPQYIVDHIVMETVGPALDERLEEAESLFAQQSADGRDRSERVLNRVLTLRILDPAMGSGHFLVRALNYLSDRLAEWLAEKPTDNSLTVLVADIRARILESLREQEMSEEFIAAAEERLTDNNLLKRLLMKKCIYGVDYNEMAVELAKLSLWLSSFTLGAPLSFLDHHLRCGNSLIGADFADLWGVVAQSQAGQQSALGLEPAFGDIYRAARHMDELAALTDATFADIERSAELFEQYYSEIRPYRVMLNLWVARFFGSDMPADALNIYGRHVLSLLTGGEAHRNDEQFETAIVPRLENWLIHSETVVDDPYKRFFHWELEFPEVYFSEGAHKPDGGFDVVIGNPPYIRIQNRDNTPEFKRWYAHRYTSAFGNYDIYVLFVEQALRLLAPGGRHGFIVYNKWMHSEYGTKLRGLLAARRAVQEIVDFADNQVFPRLTTYTCLLFTANAESSRLRYTLAPLLGNESDVAERMPQVLDALAPAWDGTDDGVVATERLAQMLAPLQLSGQVQTDYFPSDELGEEPWAFTFGAARPLRARVKAAGTPLLGVTLGGDTIFQGLVTGMDAVFIVRWLAWESDSLARVYSDAAEQTLDIERELLRPLVSGEDVDPFVFAPTRKCILFPYHVGESGASLIPASELVGFECAWEYLTRFEQRLRSREGGEFDDDGWYRYSRHQNIDKQHLPKICFAETVTKLEAALDAEGEFCTHNLRVNSVVLPIGSDVGDYRYLLALLNSRLLDWAFKSGSVGRHAQGHYAANKQFIKDLPVYVPGDTTEPEERAALLADFEARRANATSSVRIRDVCSWCDRTFLTRRRADDVARDVLVYLAEQVEQGMARRQRERARFLSSLSRQLGTDWEEMSGRAALARYDERDFNGLLDTLSQPGNIARYTSRAQRGFSPRSRALKGTIEQSYDSSLRTLRPLARRVRRDQQLIDHIVYRLYGLTDEEIAFVEEA